jgi:outer membrane protein assembly factor BamB
VSGETVPAPRKPLRLWPGIVAVALQWLARFGLKAVIPGFQGFALAAQGGLIGAAAVVSWWVFFSRAARVERLGGVVLMIAALGGTWYLRDESMGPFWLLAYAIPVVCLAFVLWAVAARGLADGPRRATMVATILLACGAWTLMRTEGISGDHVATFAWRWSKSPEQRALEMAARAPAAPPPAPAKASAEWPGFRGPRRDGIVHGVRIATDWSAAPPVEMWRRPVGPGWSSFAVQDGLLYTQEQRAGEEVVACYEVATGQPVWTHADRARFFESNAGAGPRATPTLSRDRLYTFGATGILNALDARNGAVAWSHDVAAENGLEVPYWGFSSSPLVLDDLVVIAAGGQLLAYDLGSGRPRWSGPPGQGYSSPQLATIDGVAQILQMTNAGVISVAPADGHRLWEHAWKGFPMVQPALTADGDVLVVASSASGTRRLAVAQGPEGWTAAERWTSLSLKPYFNDFVVHQGHAYGFDGRILACIDLVDGARKWKGGRYGNGQLVLLPDQDLLLVLSEDGELALVKAAPDAFTELARRPVIEGKTWNHPVLVGDIVLVRNSAEMAALRLPRGK